MRSNESIRTLSVWPDPPPTAVAVAVPRCGVGTEARRSYVSASVLYRVVRRMTVTDQPRGEVDFTTAPAQETHQRK
jgi:hypothetical protein